MIERETMGKRVLVIHGPNLNMLGKREPSIYGDKDLDGVNSMIEEKARELGLTVTIRQSNHEGEIVEIIHSAPSVADVVIINPGAYTHTSIAIRDAFLCVNLPVIETHLSNIHKREQFRRHSYIADIAVGSVMGFGPKSYELALTAAASL